jgi:2'-5' RNA ligase
VDVGAFCRGAVVARRRRPRGRPPITGLSSVLAVPVTMRSMAFAAGQTAIIIPVGAAEPIVGRWRRQFDLATAAGVPAHVTIIYPFLSEQDLDEDAVRDVRHLVARHPSFTVTFASCGQFPDVLFLVPDDPFRRLITEVFQRWPDAPPYAGLIIDPVPHLTINHGASLSLDPPMKLRCEGCRIGVDALRPGMMGLV